MLRPALYTTGVSPNPVGSLPIFIGSARDASNPQKLHQLGITNVLNVARDVHTPPGQQDPRVRYFKVTLDDVPFQSLMGEETTRALQIIDQAVDAQQQILVHCRAGVSRSVSIVILWLMTRLNLTYDEALSLIRFSRPMARPNYGFQKQLRSLSS